MISALAWMPRGKAKAVPTKYEPTEEEMEELRKAAGELEKEGDDEEEWEDMSDDGSEEEHSAAVTKARKAARAAAAGGDDLAEYNLEDYDKEPGDAVGIFGKGLSHFEDNTEDPYITLPDAADDSEEEDDNIIRPTDSIILACHSEEDGHTLEVYVFDYQQGSLFVHHDLMLNAFPLCVEWLDTARKDGTSGSFAALGTMDTAIEVWDLDCIDSLLPAAVLGGEDTAAPEGVAAAVPKGKKKKKKEPKRPLREGSHRDAVLGLSWNRLQRHVLASASADKSVKIWDVPRERCLHSLTHHAGKVQALQWHPTEAAALLSGGFDRRAAVVDVRATAADWRAAARWELAADVECVAWDPHGAGGHLFLVSTDDGTVTCHDARRAGAAPVFTIGAHAEAATGMSLNARVPGLLATCSLDKTVRDPPPPLSHTVQRACLPSLPLSYAVSHSVCFCHSLSLSFSLSLSLSLCLSLFLSPTLSLSLALALALSPPLLFLALTPPPPSPLSLCPLPPAPTPSPSLSPSRIRNRGALPGGASYGAQLETLQHSACGAPTARRGRG